jgi:hypothetical protein
MPPKPKTLRCAYVERGRRCGRKGTGNPPLCESHRVVLDAEAARPARPGERLVNIIGKAFRGHKIDDEALYEGIEDFVGMFSRATGDPAHDPVAAARARAADFIRKTRQQQHPDGFANPPRPRPRQPPPPPHPTGPDPRLVLGFAIGQKVTAEEVKKRHRELARKHHPDRGGSVARMQEVNRAVDEIMATL